MLGTRCGPVGTRIYLILETLCSILGTQIGSLKRLNKTLDLSVCYKTLKLNKFSKRYIFFATYLK